MKLLKELAVIAGAVALGSGWGMLMDAYLEPFRLAITLEVAGAILIGVGLPLATSAWWFKRQGASQG